MGCRDIAFAATVLLAAVAHQPVLAADAKRPAKAVEESQVPDVPGDDIFGFTSPTDVGKPGDTGVALENDGRISKRDGSYGVLTNKLEFSRTITDNFWAAVSLFGAYHHMSGVTVTPADRSRYDFDGISAEFAYRILERSIHNPFAATVSVEPRWARIDGVTGIHAEAWWAEFKLFVDAPVIPEKLFWGFNFNWAPSVQQVLGSTGDLARASGVNVSTALTYAITPTFMLGAEAKFLSGYADYFFRAQVGRAFFLGPTVYWKINERVAFNAAFLPQIAGRAATNPGLAFDLDNFERAIFRVKFAATF